MSKEKYTPKLRKRIIERDKGRCQFPVYDEKRGWRVCGSTDHPECHHVSPQRWSETNGNKEVNNGDNLITLGRRHHQRTVHKDMPECLDDYGRQKRAGVEKPDSFDKMFSARNKMCQEGQEYWDTSWDGYFAARAEERSHLMEEREDGFYIAGKKQNRKK